jgi:hypothetical protein
MFGLSVSQISSDIIVGLICLLIGFIGRNFVTGVKQCPHHAQIHEDIALLKNSLPNIEKGIDKIQAALDAETGVWSRLRTLETRVSLLEKK